MLNIIVNNGSASKKYSLYDENGLLLHVHYEKVEDYFLKTEKRKESEESNEIELDEFNNAYNNFIDSLIKYGFIKDEQDISKIGIRIVAPGSFFLDHYKIDNSFLESLEENKKLSPLHIDPVQKEINAILDKMPKIDLYAISDSVFHKNKPDYANIYAYPKDLTEKLDLHRFGYHGLSVSSIVNSLKEKDELPEKLIVCHLGGGSSITAVLNGESIDNTMGYSPMEGIPMATRSGNVDPNTIFAIMDEKDFDKEEIQQFLYKECGFKGISGLTGDTRVILRETQKGNQDAKLALDYYAYEIKKTIGAYKTILGGLDTIVFTGTIGVRSSDVRKRICDGLESSGIEIDQAKNKLTVKNNNLINEATSESKILVMETNEMDEMNRILSEIS
jgi:acetate kinase